MRLIRSNEVPYERLKISGAISAECGAGFAGCQPSAATLRRHESSLLTSSRNAAPQPIRFSVGWNQIKWLWAFRGAAIAQLPDEDCSSRDFERWGYP